MNKSKIKAFALILLAAMLPFISACGETQATAVNTPAPVAQIVTRVVTQEFTQVITKVVEVPVTVTPAPTEAPTSTPDASSPASTPLPLAVLPAYTDCQYGPADFFVYKTSFPAGQEVDVLGRNADSGWLNIEAKGDWNSCWIPSDRAQLQVGQVGDLPVVKPLLPRSEYEFGSPQITTTKRDGDEVSLSWDAVYMSADEVQGYLIEASVCQGGQLTDQYVFVPVTFAENNGTISTTISDEASCESASTAHIVSMGRRGFAEWEKIFWPPHP